MAGTFDSDFNIALTRGDLFEKPVKITKAGQPYILTADESLVFSVKSDIYSKEILIRKTFTAKDQNENGVFILVIEPEETESLAFGTYKYDVAILPRTNTIITVRDFVIDGEVHT